jgi:hypothetical protein
MPFFSIDTEQLTPRVQFGGLFWALNILIARDETFRSVLTLEIARQLNLIEK